jgi:hypothetical protein
MPSVGFSTFRAFLMAEESVAVEALTAVVAALSRTMDWPVGESVVRADTPLAELGLDDLAAVLICDNSAELGWSLSPHDVFAAVTVADLAAAATGV